MLANYQPPAACRSKINTSIDGHTGQVAGSKRGFGIRAPSIIFPCFEISSPSSPLEKKELCAEEEAMLSAAAFASPPPKPPATPQPKEKPTTKKAKRNPLATSSQKRRYKARSQKGDFYAGALR